MAGMNGWAELGSMLSGGGIGNPETYTNELGRLATVDRSIEQARRERSRRIVDEVRTNKFQTTADANYADLGFRNQAQMDMALGDNPDNLVANVAKANELGWRQQAVNAGVQRYGESNPNAYLMGVASGPQALTAIQDGVQIQDRFADGGGGLTVTPLGEASIAQRRAAAAASQASAANSYASAASTRQDMRGGGSGSGGKAPSGYRWTADGALEPIPGGPADKGGALGDVQLPVTAVRLIRDDLEAMDAAGTMDAVLGRAKGRIERGELQLGRVANTVSGVRNWTGSNNDNSRNYQSFISDLNKARNESLRLNKGVQTEGDAQRAWDELIANPTDSTFVLQRINEIEELNRRAMRLRQANVDMVRTNFGAAPMDFDSRQRALGDPSPAAAPAPRRGPAPGAVQGGYRFRGGDPASPSSWEPVR